MHRSIINNDQAARLTAVLSGLQFPAWSWEIIAQADYYGADIYTKTELAALPEGKYLDLAAAIEAVQACPRTRGRIYHHRGRYPRYLSLAS